MSMSMSMRMSMSKLRMLLDPSYDMAALMLWCDHVLCASAAGTDTQTHTGELNACLPRQSATAQRVHDLGCRLVWLPYLGMESSHES
jgi:hypothetical protein